MHYTKKRSFNGFCIVDPHRFMPFAHIVELVADFMIVIGDSYS